MQHIDGKNYAFGTNQSNPIREVRVKNSLQKYRKTTIQHRSRCVQACPERSRRAMIRFAGLESGLVLDIYYLMPYANTK